MSKNHHQNNPPEPDPNEHQTPEPHKVEYLGEAFVLFRHIAAYMPTTEKKLVAWIDQYISTAETNQSAFPAVFNAGGTFTISSMKSLRSRLAEAYASIDSLMGLLRAMIAYKNLILFNRGRGALKPPRLEANTVPTNQANFTGFTGIIDDQVKLLRTQSGFNQVLAQQFGIIQQPPSSDPPNYDPQLSANFTGGVVGLRFRAAGGRLGADVVEIRVDRGDGNIQFIGSTTFARFTDHHPLPATRTVWTFMVNYADRNGIPVGIQSKVDIAVQAMSGI